MREQFERILTAWLQNAEQTRVEHIDIISRQLHCAASNYPGPNHRMPVCCQVMINSMEPGDLEVEAPPQGNGATLKIRYYLPRN